MAKLTVRPSEIVTLDFRQEKGDQDYGTCMWALFRLDTERYDMMIMSDCGNHSYGWIPTPDSETFFHLLARLDEGYLLEKLSDRTVVDSEKTFAAVKEYISEVCEDCEEDDWPDMDEVKSACNEYGERAVYGALVDACRGTSMEHCDSYELACLIEKDYPASAKKIVQVFMQYIRPKCRELDQSAAGPHGMTDEEFLGLLRETGADVRFHYEPAMDRYIFKVEANGWRKDVEVAWEVVRQAGAAIGGLRRLLKNMIDDVVKGENA